MGEDPQLTIKEQELSEKIETFIEEEIQPFVASDGGHIQFIQFNIRTGVVIIQMQGACSTCPSSTMTLSFGIEMRLKEAFPEITKVEAQAPPSLLNLIDD